MAVPVETLQASLDALIRARSSGLLSVRDSDGSERVYKTDAQMQRAQADLERRIAAASSPPVNTIRFITSKGL